jgi:uncharacterized protein YegP (UPF0339 family)
MAGKGELYQRKDKKWAFRVKAANGQIVATDGSQGYESKTSARSTLTKLLAGKYNECGIYARKDGKFVFRVKASNGQTVATDGSQGYEARSSAKKTSDKILAGTYDGPIIDA